LKKKNYDDQFKTNKILNDEFERRRKNTQLQEEKLEDNFYIYKKKEGPPLIKNEVGGANLDFFL